GREPTGRPRAPPRGARDCGSPRGQSSKWRRAAAHTVGPRVTAGEASVAPGPWAGVASSAGPIPPGGRTSVRGALGAAGPRPGDRTDLRLSARPVPPRPVAARALSAGVGLVRPLLLDRIGAEPLGLPG